MGALLLLVRRQLRRHPGQAIAVFLISVVTGLLANTGLMLATHYAPDLAAKATQWRSPDAIALVSDTAEGRAIAARLARDPDVHQVETLPTRAAQGTLNSGGVELAAIMAFYDRTIAVDLGRRTVTDQLAAPVERPVWAPAVLLASGRYALGDAITIKTGRVELAFHIQGFVEDSYGGTPGFGMMMFGLDPGALAALDSGLASTTLIKIDAASATTANDALGRATAGLASTDTVWWDANLNLLDVGAGMSSGIFAMVMIAFAAVITGVTLVVLWFLVRNEVATDVVSFGALRALGFTTALIMAGLVASFVAVAAVGSVAGAVGSFAILPVIATSLRAQSGVSWTPTPDLPIIAASGVALVLVVFVTATASAARIRRLTTVDALRGGVRNHSFRSDPLPLGSVRGPLPVVLGLKGALQRWRQGLVLAGTVGLVTFAAVFSLGMTGTLLGDPQASIRLLVGEIEDVTVRVAPDADVTAVTARLASLPGVQRAFPQTTNGYQDPQVVSLFYLVTDDPTVWRYNPVVAGRLPRHDNEVALGASLAQQLRLGVGDRWTAELEGRRAEYLVTGLASGGRNMGRFVVLTTAGFQQVQPTFVQRVVALYVSGDPREVKKQIQRDFSTEVLDVANTREGVQVELSGYLATVPVLANTVVGFTGFVVVLVVTLIVTTMLIQSRRELGIAKALGFANSELSRQTRWTYLPGITLGAAVGAAIGSSSLGTLLGLLLRGIGIVKVEVVPDVVQAAGVALGVVALALVVTWLVALRIRWVSAYALMGD